MKVVVVGIQGLAKSNRQYVAGRAGIEVHVDRALNVGTQVRNGRRVGVPVVEIELLRGAVDVQMAVGAFTGGLFVGADVATDKNWLRRMGNRDGVDTGSYAECSHCHDDHSPAEPIPGVDCVTAKTKSGMRLFSSRGFEREEMPAAGGVVRTTVQTCRQDAIAPAGDPRLDRPDDHVVGSGASGRKAFGNDLSHDVRHVASD